MIYAMTAMGVTLAVWDFAATAIGISYLFGASTFGTWAFSFIAAIALSSYLYATKFAWIEIPGLFRIFSITAWLICFLFDIYTTFVGNLAFALDSKYRDLFDTNLRQLITTIDQLNAHQFGIIIVTTLFVVASTIAIGVRFGP